MTFQRFDTSAALCEEVRVLLCENEDRVIWGGKWTAPSSSAIVVACEEQSQGLCGLMSLQPFISALYNSFPPAASNFATFTSSLSLFVLFSRTHVPSIVNFVIIFFKPNNSGFFLEILNSGTRVYYEVCRRVSSRTVVLFYSTILPWKFYAVFH